MHHEQQDQCQRHEDLKEAGVQGISQPAFCQASPEESLFDTCPGDEDLKTGTALPV